MGARSTRRGRAERLRGVQRAVRWWKRGPTATKTGRGRPWVGLEKNVAVGSWQAGGCRLEIGGCRLLEVRLGMDSPVEPHLAITSSMGIGRGRM